MSQRGRLVYSSGPGSSRDASSSNCRRCAADPCRCEPSHSVAPERHDVRVRRDRSGRRGKTVTCISGLPLDEAELRTLAGELKRRCGCGGSVDGGLILIQGDRREQLRAELSSRGYTVKLAGG